MDIELAKELLKAFGWREIGSRNPLMLSFIKEEDDDFRLNIYYTTGTVTMQGRDGSFRSIKDVINIEQLEDFIR